MRAPVGELDRLAQGRVVRDLVHGGDRRGQRETGRQVTGLDHRQHERRGAVLEVDRHLGAVGVADDDVQAPVLLGVGVRLVAGVDDRALERGLEADADLDVVGALADLERVHAAVLLAADAAGPGDHLAGDEERREVLDDGLERDVATHQVVLVRAVGRALVVDVVLVEDHRRRAGHPAGQLGAEPHHLFARLLPHHDVARVGDLRAGVLRVGVVDVQAGAVGEDDVGQPEVLVGELRRVGGIAAQVEPAGVAQRVLLLEVPARPTGESVGRGVGVDHVGRRHHRVGVRLPLDGDAVLDLAALNAANSHTESLRVALRGSTQPWRGAGRRGPGPDAPQRLSHGRREAPRAGPR